MNRRMVVKKEGKPDVEVYASGFVFDDNENLTVYDDTGRSVAYFKPNEWDYVSQDNRMQLTPLLCQDAETGEEIKVMMTNGGLRGSENHIMYHLIDAWNGFTTLDVPDSLKKEFVEGVHKCQMVLGQLALSRLFPDYWNDK